MSASTLDTAKKEFPENRGTHHSTLKGYSVQAMFDYDAPRMIAGQLFDTRWREVSFAKAPPEFGVPAHDQFNAEIVKHGLYGYEAAQALRWWFHAVARVEGNEYFLKTRLVEHSVKVDTVVTAEQPIEERDYKRGAA